MQTYELVEEERTERGFTIANEWSVTGPVPRVGDQIWIHEPDARPGDGFTVKAVRWAVVDLGHGALLPHVVYPCRVFVERFPQEVPDALHGLPRHPEGPVRSGVRRGGAPRG